LLAAADFGHNTGHAGGIFGLITGGLALLVAFIEVLNATAGREVISLGTPMIS
jgi:succinate-acetate transporter protein